MAAPRNPTSASGARDLEHAELLQRVARGDQQALSALYDATSRFVYGLILRVVQDAGEAEEVLLDVYTQVWRQASRYSAERGSPLAWLTTIARSRAIDRLRAGRLEHETRAPLDLLTESAGGASVEETVAARETQLAVRAALDALTPEQREVIDLAYYGGLSHSEIAARTGQPLGTVKTRTRLGMMKLREMLKATYEGTR